MLKMNPFGKHYENGGWGSGNKSGPGSTLYQTIAIRTYLPILLKRHNVQTFLDISCGGMCWLPKVLSLRPEMKFIGLDIAHSVIKENQKKFMRNKNWSFDCVNYTKQRITHTVDMAICRHTMMHLGVDDAKMMLDNLWQSAKVVLLTSHEGVKVNPTNNRRELVKGVGGGFHWAHMNMLLPPFNLRKPDFKFKETTTNQDEFIYVYVVEQLPYTGIIL
jgi:hypothetical protein